MWAFEVARHVERLRRVTAGAAVGKLSGAVGAYNAIDPRVEELVCAELGIGFEPISNQVVQRDRHACFLSCLAVIGASLEKFAVEVRHLQRTEVREAEEAFGKGQKGSSAMPHKRNPILSERMAGCARVLRGNAMVGLENVALWHERDISHSSAERIVLPDSCILLDYMLQKSTTMFDRLVVDTDRMVANLGQSQRLVFSGRCCSPSSTRACCARTPTASCRTRRCAPGARASTSARSSRRTPRRWPCSAPPTSTPPWTPSSTAPGAR